MELKEIIEGFKGELKKKSEAHEEISDVTSKIILLSKHGIMAIHRGEVEDAQSKLMQMERMRIRLDEILHLHPELYTNSVRVSFQEYSEAHIFLSLVKSGSYPDPRELKMPAISYILGLADTVGEFRRRALGSLIVGDLREAERCLKIMEEIYVELISLEEAYVLASELRRKCDIARRIIDSTVGDIMMETRRASLQKTVELLEKEMRRLKEKS